MSKALRIVLWVLGGLLALLIIVPMLIPSASYRQAAEKAATNALGMPVKIGTLVPLASSLVRVACRWRWHRCFPGTWS